MKIIRGAREVLEATSESRRRGLTIGLVPTMGWFHEGHLSLMRRARAECGLTVVTLFVNPAQFGDPRDLAAYPRDEERDCAMAAAEGVDIVFAPSATEMYPRLFATTVTVLGVSEPFEGQARGATHFAGVATILAKMFNIVQPTVAYFGQKDAQQALVVRKLVRDMNVPVRIEVCPTIREPDGLAMSSRNVRLGPADRTRALALRAGLEAGLEAIRRGERHARAVESAGREAMRAIGVEPEYFAAVPAETLLPTDTLTGEVLLAVAARVGDVRLIDNEIVRIA